MNAATQLVAVGLISLLGAGGTYLVKGPPVRKLACDVTTLKPDEVCLQQIPADAKVLWVDARTRKEWKKNGLKGSVLWNLDQLQHTDRNQRTGRLAEIGGRLNAVGRVAGTTHRPAVTPSISRVFDPGLVLPAPRRTAKRGAAERLLRVSP